MIFQIPHILSYSTCIQEEGAAAKTSLLITSLIIRIVMCATDTTLSMMGLKTTWCHLKEYLAVDLQYSYSQILLNYVFQA
jgi:hypothetical protein